MYPSKKTPIAYLKVDEAPFKVSSKYADFTDIFSLKLAVELPKYIRINNHTIELVDNQQSTYGPIYSLEPIKLEILKVYIKNNLVNSFIKSFKFSAKAFIFFDKKPNRSLRLCIDYKDLNNLTIKNWYLLPLVKKSLN